MWWIDLSYLRLVRLRRYQLHLGIIQVGRYMFAQLLRFIIAVWAAVLVFYDLLKLICDGVRIGVAF